MLRATRPSSRVKSKRMSAKQGHIPYKVSLDPNISPHSNYAQITQQEINKAKQRNLAPGVIPYYGDDLGVKQMRPWDERKYKFWQRIGRPDVERKIEEWNVF